MRWHFGGISVFSVFILQCNSIKNVCEVYRASKNYQKPVFQVSLEESYQSHSKFSEENFEIIIKYWNPQKRSARDRAGKAFLVGCQSFLRPSRRHRRLWQCWERERGELFLIFSIFFEIFHNRV